jgi:predicted dienelactone hydrolase/CubicO group peptidase (beta-lactamase class C family)
MSIFSRLFTAGLWLALASIGVSQTADPVSRTFAGRQVDLTKLFERLDGDRDERLSRKEFKELAGLGQGNLADRPEILDRIFGALDRDKNGALSREEFNGLSELHNHFQGKAPSGMKPPASGAVSKPAAAANQEPVFRQKAFEMEMMNATWVDAPRNREVPVRIYAPSLKGGAGPFPVIVFSHGGGESREAFDYLGRPLAQNGYITIFLTHIGGDRQTMTEQGMKALGDTGNYANRLADMRFAADHLLSAGLDEPLLKGRIDRDRIAAAGQCAGSTTAMAMCGLGLNLPGQPQSSSVDPRFKVCVALSPQVPFAAAGGGQYGLYDRSWASLDPDTPLLVVTGSRDFRWVPDVRSNPDLRKSAYDQASSRTKYLVDIEGAEHNAFTDSMPYYPARERDPRHHGWIAQVVTEFLDAYLKQDDSALEWLADKRLQNEAQGECRQENTVTEKTTAATLAPQTYDFSAVDAFLEKSLPRMDGGCGLILVQGEQVIYRKAFGTFEPETVVPIASASKWISGGVIMALVDDGVLSLDDKAAEYLPDFPPEKSGITIRQMFSHTHGLPDQPPYHRDTTLTMAECVHKIAAMKPVADPGTALYYSGTGMQAAGYIATLASGKPWVELFREKIGDPLNMKNTDYHAFGRTENPNVAGSIETCIDDYGAFVAMILNKGVYHEKRILSEQAVDVMLSVQSGDVPILRHPWQGYTDFDPHMAQTPYGIGCWLEEVDPHTGKALRASSGGAFGCQPFIDLKRNVAGVFLPHTRTMKRSSSGHPYNDASVVYLELRELLNTIFDSRPVAGKPEQQSLQTTNGIVSIPLVTLDDKARNKLLQVRITAPADGGPFPVILFSHYSGGTKDDYNELINCWAGRGYICLVPNHADSPQAGGQRGPAALQGWRDRALDLRFLLDSLAGLERTVPELTGKLDLENIGVGGHYIGAHSAALLAGMKVFGSDGQSETFADPRVKAVLMLSPTGRGQGLTDASWADMNLPMFVITGSNDPSRRTGHDPQWRTEPFQFAPPGNKYLAFIPGLDGSYGNLFGQDPQPTDISRCVQSATLAFWDAYLKGNRAAITDLKSNQLPAFSKETARIEHK